MRKWKSSVSFLARASPSRERSTFWPAPGAAFTAFGQARVEDTRSDHVSTRPSDARQGFFRAFSALIQERSLGYRRLGGPARAAPRRSERFSGWSGGWIPVF